MQAKIGCLLAAALSLVCAGPPTASAQTAVKFAIDWVFQGLHAPFAVAAQKKYFEREGLAVKVDRGNGSSDTIAKVASGTYDIGYGNTNLLVKFNHDNPNTAITSVFLLYDATPLAVVALKSSGINEAKDLNGKNIAAPVGDDARHLFGALARFAGINAASVQWTSVQPAIRDTLLFQRRVDAVAGHGPTMMLSLGKLGVPHDDLTIIPYSKYMPDLLGAGVFTTQKMIKEQPGIVRAFVKAMVSAMQDTLTDPKAAVALLARYDQLIDQIGETDRLVQMIDLSMKSPLLKERGLGTVSPERLRKAVDILAEFMDAEPPQDLSTIYTEEFLPPSAQRRF